MDDLYINRLLERLQNVNELLGNVYAVLKDTNETYRIQKANLYSNLPANLKNDIQRKSYVDLKTVEIRAEIIRAEIEEKRLLFEKEQIEWELRTGLVRFSLNQQQILADGIVANRS